MVAQGVVFNIQRGSVQDGPGIRTTVFFKGCPLTCPWCHNPEGRSAGLEVWHLDGRCGECGRCLDVCPDPPTDGTFCVEPARCTRCGGCVAVCPSGAREILGRKVTVDEVVREVERDRRFYEESGGGVTFSGGEPFLQAEFLLECLQACRKRSIHTVVDTSGHTERAALLAAAEWTNLFLYDIKIFDNERHRREIGVPVDTILENLRALDDAGAAIWVRMPVIPGINDDVANLDALAGFVAALRKTRRIHLLPYHRNGSDKATRLGKRSDGGHFQPPSKAALESTADLLRTHGLDVHVGG